MAYRINGIGTWPCVAGYDIGTGHDDGVECFTFFFLPIVPYRPIHIYGRRGMIYQAMAIRWSGPLVFRAMVKPWLAMVLTIGLGLFLIFGLVCLMVWVGWVRLDRMSSDLRSMALLMLLGFGLSLSAFAAFAALGLTSRRARRIRTLLASAGRDSDPVTWLPDTFADLTLPAKRSFGTDTYAAAVEPLLARGEFGRAMWAARLCTSWENKTEGEQLTQMVLEHPGASAILARVSMLGSLEAEPMSSPAPPFARRTIRMARST
jgi:hypothetical protein